MYRILPLFALLLSMSWSATAQDVATETRDALVVRGVNFRLTVIELTKNNQEMTYPVSFDAVVIIEDKRVALEDLKRDALVRVTTKPLGDTTWVVKVEGVPDNITGGFEGLITAFNGNRMTVRNQERDLTYTYPVAGDVRVIHQGKRLSPEDLHVGGTVKTKTAKRGPNEMVVQIDVQMERLPIPPSP